MSENQHPKPYDAVLGGQNVPEGAAVLGGIQGVKLRLSNSNPQVRIAALHQALNYGERGLDLIIKALEDESPQVQIQAYSLLVPLSEQKVKRALLEFNPHNLKLESIEVVTVNRDNEIIQSQQRLAKYYVENLGDRTTLEMAAIPGGTFLMGASGDRVDDIERYDSETPQHLVTIPPFYMGKYSITQAQWRTVAKLEKVNHELEINPSHFQGDNHPVERVSWYDAVEFCARLSKATGKKYRLPSEAEWEYACRGGTTTTFHFGEIITGELANYNNSDNNYNFVSEPPETYRKQTTPVGLFPPNAFGLYDMHGLVWEWCLDDWHQNYQGAPTNGSPWFDTNENLLEKSANTIIRGGSWFHIPDGCRSAFRMYYYDGEVRHNVSKYIGFRIACDIF